MAAPRTFYEVFTFDTFRVRTTVPLVASGIINGRVEFVGRVDPLHGSDGLHVLHSAPGATLPPQKNTDPSGRVGADGGFTVAPVLGDACLWLWGLPPGWRPIDITLDGQDYTHRPFSLESGQVISGVLIRVEPADREHAITFMSPQNHVCTH